MKHQRLAFLLSLLLGGLFIFSGYNKMMDTAAFLATVDRFDLPSFMESLALFIPTFEMALGAALVLQVMTKRLGMVAVGTLVVLTSMYLYGWLVKGVEDCGCFGAVSFLDSSPLIVIVRNIILLVIAGAVWRLDYKEGKTQPWAWMLVGVVAVGAGLMSGKTSVVTAPGSSAGVEQNINPGDRFDFSGQKVADTPLAPFLTADPTKKYLVFVFSLTCPHCWDALENVKAYQESGIVDEIVGITFGSEPELAQFRTVFRADFPITLYPTSEVTKLTSSVPRLFFVQNEWVRYTMLPPVISPQTFYTYVNR